MIGLLLLFAMVVTAMSGCFETTEERAVRFGDDVNDDLLDGRDLDSPAQRGNNFCRSVNNICLDGEGIN